MKQLKVLNLTLVIAALFIDFGTVALAAQSDAKAVDQPKVVLAVAPVYPAIALFMNAKGEVVIEIKIDMNGKVLSASTISGSDYLRDSSKKAGMKWQFAAVKEGPKERAARLTLRTDTPMPLSPSELSQKSPLYSCRRIELN